MRRLSPAQAAALAAGTIVPAFLVELDLGIALLHLWTGVGQLTWHGRVFGFPAPAAGAAANPPLIASVSNVEEGAEGKATGLTYSLSGIPFATAMGQTLVAIAANGVRQGGHAKLWQATMDASGTQLLGDPWLLADTLVDVPLIRITGNSIAITISTETRAARNQNRRGRRNTDEDQQLDYPGDRFFEYKNELQDKQLK